MPRIFHADYELLDKKVSVDIVLANIYAVELCGENCSVFINSGRVFLPREFYIPLMKMLTEEEHAH